MTAAVALAVWQLMEVAPRTFSLFPILQLNRPAPYYVQRYTNEHLIEVW